MAGSALGIGEVTGRWAVLDSNSVRARTSGGFRALAVRNQAFGSGTCALSRDELAWSGSSFRLSKESSYLAALVKLKSNYNPVVILFNRIFCDLSC